MVTDKASRTCDQNLHSLPSFAEHSGRLESPETGRILQPRVDRILRQHILNVESHQIGPTESPNPVRTERNELLVGNRDDNGVISTPFRLIEQLDAVLVPGLVLVNPRIIDIHLTAKGAKFADEFCNLCVIEAGPAYIWEDYDKSDDDDYAAAHWGLRFDHYLVEAWKLQAFHKHTLDWNVEEASAYLLKTATGLRIPIFDSFQATVQVNFDRNNNPAAGAKKDDYEYLLTGGYTW